MKNPKIILLPGPAGAGRDYLLDLLLGNQEIISSKIGRPVRLGIARKITDRQSRGEKDALKKCVSTEDFVAGVKAGQIIAPYILESNGKNYGYEVDAFNSDEHDILFADASVYQLPELRKQLSDRAYVLAMVNSRADREANMTRRGSESPEEIQKRLNLGDAHVALLCTMGQKPFGHHIHPELHLHLTNEDAHRVREFTGSEHVFKIYKQIGEARVVDEIWELGQEHRINDGDDPIQSRFFQKGVEATLEQLLSAIVV